MQMYVNEFPFPVLSRQSSSHKRKLLPLTAMKIVSKETLPGKAQVYRKGGSIDELKPH